MRRTRLAQLAIAAVFFLIIGTNTHIGATNTSGIALPSDKAHEPRRGQDIAYNLQALSPKQADLYRAIFTAQAKGDWQTADRVIGVLSDKRLLGHVLADRYLRRGASVAALKAWLTTYGALPEAQDIYEQAHQMAAAKNMSLPKPVSADTWTGAGDMASAGFKTTGREGAVFRTMWESGLDAWKHGEAVNAGEIFAKLATQSGLSSWDVAAAEFWAYRSLKRSGNNEQAYYWLRQAADHPRTFYGLLANDLMGHNLELSWQVPEMDKASQDVLAAHAAGWRALALVQAGRSDLAEAELSRLNPLGHRDLQQAMLALADAAHMPSLALRLGGLAVNDKGTTYDAALYPLPPWQPAKGFEVDRALMFALMRHESQFDPGAVSGRGACGLMQLMPSTARLLVKKSANDNVADECSERLRDPATNIAFGQTYVKRLADQPLIGDNLLMMLAAYNSGPNRVAHWMNEGVKRDPLLFIETLPVRETRDYVQQVFIHYVMYRARLGQPVAAVKELTRGEWPRYAIHEGAPVLPATREAKVRGIKVASNDGTR